MDLIKQYLVQSITAASGNLRLNNQRLEVIAMLKEVIVKSRDLQQSLNRMKKVTELSKLAIKLDEIHHYLLEGSIDFLKVSDKFKDHSFNLIKEINLVLDMVNPYSFRETIDGFNEQEKKVVELIIEPENGFNLKSDEDVSLQNIDNEIKQTSGQIGDTEIIKLQINEDKEQDHGELKSFDSFGTTILKPIKLVDDLLNQIDINSELPIEIEEYSKLMKTNAVLSSQNGFDILSEMHNIISEGLIHLKNKTLAPSLDVLESLRACLIQSASMPNRHSSAAPIARTKPNRLSAASSFASWSAPSSSSLPRSTSMTINTGLS